jgi:hypothetical protein
VHKVALLDPPEQVTWGHCTSTLVLFLVLCRAARLVTFLSKDRIAVALGSTPCCDMCVKFARYHFSATVHTSDAAVLHCLIGLSHWAQRGEKYPQIAWRGCGEKDWRTQGGQVTFRFTTIDRCTEWRAKATELLTGKWALISTNDNNPACPPKYQGRWQTNNRSIAAISRRIVTESVTRRKVETPVFRRSA